jgi:hypothetical protein
MSQVYHKTLSPATRSARKRSRKPAPTSLDSNASLVSLKAKEHLLGGLQAIGADAAVERLQRCCQEFRLLACENGHRWNAIPLERCWLRLCPDCAKARQAKAFHRIAPALEELQRRHPKDRVVMITLTVQSSEEVLPVIVRGFKAAFAKLRRSRQWRRCMRAATAGFEATYHAGVGWHFHAHVIGLRMAWWDQAELAEAWQKASRGWGRIVDIREITHLTSGLGEALKYVFKPANLLTWGPEQIRQFLDLGRTKLRECYGELRGLVGELEDDGEDELGVEPEELPLEEGDACPACGKPLKAEWRSRRELWPAATERLWSG